MIVSIDPGDTTGVFTSAGTHMQTTEFTVIEILDGIHESVGVEIVIMERFNLYDKRTKANAGWALDVIGAVTYWCWKNEVKLVLQWNRDKNKVPNTMLEQHGKLMRPLTKWRHANDAARHFVYYTNRKAKK